MTPADIRAAIVAELGAAQGMCLPSHAALADRVLARLRGPEAPASVTGGASVPAPDDEPQAAAEARRGSVLAFVRPVGGLRAQDAARFDGLIVCGRSSRGRVSLPTLWLGEVDRAADGEPPARVVWDWMVDPVDAAPGLHDLVERARDIGARAVLLNAEPPARKHRGTPLDWATRRGAMEYYASTAREMCDAAGMELWVTGWALPSAAPRFPWREMIAPAHRCMPQPYEVHGREGSAYVAQCLAEWVEHGAARDRLIVGRGAHELDTSDADAWRTPAEIAAHRASTPAGMDEAWWPPAGRWPAEVVGAILAG